MSSCLNARRRAACVLYFRRIAVPVWRKSALSFLPSSDSMFFQVSEVQHLAASSSSSSSFAVRDSRVETLCELGPGNKSQGKSRGRAGLVRAVEDKGGAEAGP